MKPFPSFIQHDAMDCGPTCLKIIAAFYGKKFSLETLRERSSLTREGVSLLGISEAAESIGFRTMGAAISYEKLKDAPFPCIVHWNQQHFVVVYKIKTKKSVDYINVSDPAKGKIKYTKDEFCKCWLSSKYNGEDTGVVLLLEPTPDFYEIDEKISKRGISFLFTYLRPYKNLMGQLFLGLLFGSLLQLIFPFLTQSIVDFGINNQNLGFIYLILIAQLMLTFSSCSINIPSIVINTTHSTCFRCTFNTRNSY
ncbi:hypothetical protein D0T53_04250 [Dysgonomonas sp. 216]|uniref:cysteine peptidase family C39 domain-containing protein n=1 Tax=Dysgonomonas sp. 216 TaxID=2302934 RepID=UPI0013D30981|nr:cysteine peptidase family C39 domain-containing protein [Dysgonomonas sp. 216]NDW18128.1 hypothetical protein [Dysgonomonas sp. 216]